LRRFPGVVLELRTARANSVPHSTMRHGKNPRKWSVKDRALAMALTTHEDSLCAGCGQPRDRSWNEDMDGYYGAHRVTCQGCQAVQLNIAEHGHPQGSQSIYVTDDSPAGYVPDPRMMPG
jgi:hypothetical protein